MDDSALNGVTIKIKGSEELKTDEKGNCKAIKKYQSGKTFDVELSMDGYKLVEQEIKIDERQSKNTFSFKMERKYVISTHRVIISRKAIFFS